MISFCRFASSSACDHSGSAVIAEILRQIAVAIAPWKFHRTVEPLQKRGHLPLRTALSGRSLPPKNNRSINLSETCREGFKGNHMIRFSLPLVPPRQGSHPSPSRQRRCRRVQLKDVEICHFGGNRKFLERGNRRITSQSGLQVDRFVTDHSHRQLK